MNALEVFFTDVSKVLSVFGLIAFVFAVFLHEPSTPWWHRMVFLIGIAGFTGYIIAINGTLNQNRFYMFLAHPWMASVYLAAPPALWIAFRGEFQWRKGLWLVHFLPALLALLAREFRFWGNDELLKLDVQAALLYQQDFQGNTLYIKTYVVYFVALVSSVYYVGLSGFTGSSKVSQKILALLALISFIYFVPYTLGPLWSIWRPYIWW